MDHLHDLLVGISRNSFSLIDALLWSYTNCFMSLSQRFYYTAHLLFFILLVLIALNSTIISYEFCAICCRFFYVCGENNI